MNLRYRKRSRGSSQSRASYGPTQCAFRRRHREAERAMELRSVRRFGYARTIDEDEWTYAACGDRLSPHWAKRNESERMDLRGKRTATPCMVLARMKGVRGRGRGLRRK